MQIIEYGKENSLVVVLLHGGGLSWWNFKEVAEILKYKYHVVIPLLDGHAGSDCNFKSIEDNAKEVCQYILEEFEGSVYAIGGLSLGGQILVEMLSQQHDICQKAIIESALVKPMRITNKMIDPMIKMSYGFIKKTWFAKLQFTQLHINSDLFDEYYADTCKITMDNMISFLKSNSAYQIKDTLKKASANVTIVVGGREQKVMRDSAKCLHEIISQSKLIVFQKYYHGELSMSHVQEYAELIEA